MVECVNKATEGVFTNIDKAILELSSGFALYLVTQRLQKSQEESVLILNRLRHVLHSGMLFNNVNEVGPLMVLAQERMMTGINSLECIFYQVVRNCSLVRYVPKNQVLEPKMVPLIGIFQYLIDSKKKYCRLKNCYNHPYFNILVDIDT